MHRVDVCFSLLVLALFLLPQPLAAWWDGGHKLVAQIAFDELTLQERDWVMSLLEANPTHEELFAAKIAEELGDGPSPESRMRWYFSQAAVWADLIREGKGYARAEEIRSLYHRESRHFTDFPIQARPSAVGGEAHQPVTLWSPDLEEPLGGFNSLQTLAMVLARIPDPALSQEEKSIDLLWLFHVAGDMHQPCHCAQLFNAPALPNGDRGANQIYVFGLKSQNPGARSDALHAFWDGLGNGVANDPQAILARVAMLKANSAHWRRARELAAITDPEEWWREGAALAKSVVYGPILQEILAAEPMPHPDGQDKPPIVAIHLAPAVSGAYVTQARDSGQQQILTAGLRLAAIFKDLYRRSMPGNAESTR